MSYFSIINKQLYKLVFIYVIIFKNILIETKTTTEHSKSIQAFLSDEPRILLKINKLVSKTINATISSGIYKTISIKNNAQSLLITDERCNLIANNNNSFNITNRDTNICNGEGTCVQKHLQEPTCKCNDGYIGKYCQIKSKELVKYQDKYCNNYL